MDNRKQIPEGIIMLDVKNVIIINKLVFHKECDALPESYTVYKGRKRIAYIRLRFGWLRLFIPDFMNGEIIYDKRYEDAYKGCFSDDKERMSELNIIANKITEYISKKS